MTGRLFLVALSSLARRCLSSAIEIRMAPGTMCARIACAGASPFFVACALPLFLDLDQIYARARCIALWRGAVVPPDATGHWPAEGLSECGVDRRGLGADLRAKASICFMPEGPVYCAYSQKTLVPNQNLIFSQEYDVSG